MKCSSKSTRSFASLAIVAALAGQGLVAADAQTTASLRHAVQEAVASRMGNNVVVTVDTLGAIRVPDGHAGFVATPDVSARLGQPARFSITARTDRGRTRVGEVMATVSATAEVVRTVRALSRGTVVGPADIQTTREAVLDAPMRPMPTSLMTIGAKVTRDLAAGALVTGSDLLAEPLVKNNTTVRALVRMGTVEIEADVLAMDTGARGDIIRVTNIESRRVLRARVTGKERVEVITR